MKIGIAADHAGQRLKAAIAEHLKAAGHTIVAFGPETTADDDYPLIVRPLADAIARGDVDRGIFFCGSGIGPAVAANKIAGVRAAVVENEWSARDAVEHVDVNLLTLGERVIGDALAKSIVDAYLSAEVQGGRHERRRGQIAKLEKSEPVVADGSQGMRRADR
jgi:ribose 5-phosphate isomerase B